MHSNIVTSSKRTRVINSTAAGLTNVNGTVLDMQGFTSVVFEASIGALTATQVTKLKAQAGNAADGSDMVDLAGAETAAMADGDSNKLLVLEVYRVTNKRYLRCVLERSVANAVIDSVVATQYSSRKQAESDDPATVSSTLLSVDPSPADSAHTVTTTTYGGSTTLISTTARASS